ncbi:response regulator [Neorhizobium sp. P12A]|uniref:response regulator n=1 Tax=Neorhizobium sp. P12A TaxID=2268027 RepID=UPI0011ED43D7|nr:response regulator [Neorhizobium sp. P12A]KAA0698801.1 response regulator [Neorhizobium sp. P12A]
MSAEVVRRRRKDVVVNQKVLIVEDEFLIALDLEDVVTSCGLDVVGIANSADRALAAAPLADIALVDINLSDGATGPEIGRKLAEKGIAVIFMTANPEAVSGGVEGTLGVVHKPITPRVVRETLKYAASRRTGQLAAVPSELRVFQA